MAEESSARFVSRRARLDKERALGTARNPGDSKYGNALYKNNAQENRLYSAELNRIDKQLRRASMHIDQEKKQFLQKHSQRDPMLIVIRPPSPLMMKKHKEAQYDDAEAELASSSVPGYMKPLKSKTKSANLRPTIDAFCLKTKKKVNLWEEVMMDKEKPNFKSTVMPSWPLTSEEIDDLAIGMESHKQAATGVPANGQLKSLEYYDPQKDGVKKKKKKSPRKLQESRRKDSSWKFVTEMGKSSENDDSLSRLTSPLSDSHSSVASKKSSNHSQGTSKSKKSSRDSEMENSRMARNNQTAICIVHDDGSSTARQSLGTVKIPSASFEANEDDDDEEEEDDVLEDKGVVTKEEEKTEPAIVIPKDDKKQSKKDNDKKTRTETSISAKETKTEHNESEKENGVSENSRKSDPKQRTGLEVILEAALEGMDG